MAAVYLLLFMQLRMVMKKIIGTAVLAATLASAAHASGHTGARSIVGLGCHTGDPVCFVNLDGPAFGPSTCMGNQARWDSSMPGGKNTFAVITAAYYAGKSINLNIVADCAFGGYPTFSWFNN